MDKLLQYINSLSDNERHVFSRSCGTSIGYMRKIISSNGKLFFGAALCIKIEEKTNSLVTRKDLRPHDWQEIWPELTNSDEKAA
jgi:DNA-binding transcriptional regulator YdaS (Cro superfamily)